MPTEHRRMPPAPVILVADDDEDILHLLTFRLERSGFTVVMRPRRRGGAARGPGARPRPGGAGRADAEARRVRGHPGAARRRGDPPDADHPADREGAGRGRPARLRRRCRRLRAQAVQPAELLPGCKPSSAAGRPAVTLAVVVLVLALAGATVVVAGTWRPGGSGNARLASRERLRPAAIGWWTPPTPSRRASPAWRPGSSPSSWRATPRTARRRRRTDRGVLRALPARSTSSGAAATRRLRARRVGAAFGLGDMASERAIPDLLTALDDPSVDVRAAATRSLGRLGATAAVEPLIGASVAQRVPRSVTGAALLRSASAACPTCWTCSTTPTRTSGSTPPTSSGCSARPSPRTLLPRLRDASSRSAPPRPPRWAGSARAPGGTR